MKQNQGNQEFTSLRAASSRSRLSDHVKESWVNCVLNQQVTQKQYQQEGSGGFCTLNLYSQGEQCFINPCHIFISSSNLITILGEPGMGKTLLLTQLVQHTSSHVPLLLDLTEWSPQPHQTFTDWIVTKTNRFYHIPQRQIRETLTSANLLLLLDNFDAIPTANRTSCAVTLTHLHKQYPHWKIVITTRPPLCPSLSTSETMMIQPLMKQQVRGYLDNFSPETKCHSQLQALSRIPLFLSLLSLTHRDLNLKELPSPLLIAQIQDQVLTTYIERQLGLTSLQPYSSQQLCTGLGWLARKLEAQGKTVLFIDYMHQSSDEDWLEGRFHDEIYLLCVWVIGGVMTSPIIGLSSGVLAGLLVGWFRTPLGGILVQQLHRPFGGAIASWLRRPVEQMAISQLRPPLIWLSRRFALPLLRQPLWKSLLHYGPRMIVGTVFKKSPYWVHALASIGLVATLTSQPQLPHPNQRIWEATRSMVGWGMAGAIISAVVFIPLGTSFWYAKLAGLLFGLFAGGITCIEHFVLRVFLTITQQTPWNYSHFLDKAVTCGFLYRVGRGYSFIHREVQAYFQRQF